MKFGRYETVTELGRGSMGVVYQARDPRLNRLVALKVLRTDLAAQEGFVQRFLKEAKAAAQLTHPNIVSIYDADEDQGTLYIAMELLAGDPLDRLLSHRKFTEKEALLFGIQMAMVLDYAHQHGVVHRDIKPGNIVLGPDGRIKVTDFGVARLEDPSGVQQTVAGEVLGTPAYMSPEQALGKPVDGRTDIYSLGAILYEMCTGTKPFTGTTVSAILLAIVNKNPTEPRRIDASISPELARIIMKCLSKAPEKRFETGKTLAEALQKVVQKSAAPSVVSAARFPWRLGVVVVIVMLLIGLTSLFFYHALSKKVKEWVENRPGGPTVAIQEKVAPAPVPKPEAFPDLEAAKRRIAELEKAIADARSKEKESERRQRQLQDAQRKLEEQEKKEAAALKLQRDADIEAAKRRTEELEKAIADARNKEEESEKRQRQLKDDKRKLEEQEKKEAAALKLQREAAVAKPSPFGMEFVLISPGKFTMGSPADEKGRNPNEGPQREVQISKSFYLGKYEVKVAEFREFVNATGYKTLAEKTGWVNVWAPKSNKYEQRVGLNWNNPGFTSQTESNPVVCVAWHDAVEFANWLSKKTGQVYRLATEAEWEYACRAGGTLPSDSWYSGMIAERATHAVGQKRANARGLYDMFGNAAEWCQDGYSTYEAGPVTDPLGRSKDGAKVIRGGSWSAGLRDQRCAWRRKAIGNWTSPYIGFRLVKEQE